MLLMFTSLIVQIKPCSGHISACRWRRVYIPHSSDKTQISMPTAREALGGFTSLIVQIKHLEKRVEQIEKVRFTSLIVQIKRIIRSITGFLLNVVYIPHSSDKTVYLLQKRWTQ